MSQRNRHLALLINVMLTCDGDVSVAQCLACRVNSETITNPAAKFLSQYVERTLARNSF